MEVEQLPGGHTAQSEQVSVWLWVWLEETTGKTEYIEGHNSWELLGAKGLGPGVSAAGRGQEAV